MRRPASEKMLVHLRRVHERARGTKHSPERVAHIKDGMRASWKRRKVAAAASTCSACGSRVGWQSLAITLPPGVFATLTSPWEVTRSRLCMACVLRAELVDVRSQPTRWRVSQRPHPKRRANEEARAKWLGQAASEPLRDTQGDEGLEDDG